MVSPSTLRRLATSSAVLLFAILPRSDAAEATTTVTITVAAASDLKFAFDDLCEAFRRAHHNATVTATYGSSGTLYAQITNGGPFDLLLSADAAYPRRLIEAGLAVKESEFVYAVGHVVIWVPRDSAVDPSVLMMDTLTHPAIRKIALANPMHAPYGRAATQAIKAAGLYDQIRGKLVFGENAAQAAQFVESGAADAGLIAKSLALSPPMRDKGKFWEVPAGLHQPIEQCGVILHRARDSTATAELRAFIIGPEGRSILARRGLSASGDEGPIPKAGRAEAQSP